MRKLERNECPVLPVGLVNLSNGKNAMFGSIFDCWEEDATATNILLVERYPRFSSRGTIEKPRNYVVHTSGSADNYKLGDVIELAHDQSHHRMGEWLVVGKVPHTPTGLETLNTLTKAKSLRFATFK